LRDTLYTVEEVSERLAITPRTLHYYEEIGLIPAVPRTDGGHRYYDQAMIERLEHILRIKNVLGASLHDVSTILEAENNLNQIKVLYRAEESDAEKLKLLDQGAELLNSLVYTIDEKIDKLEKLRASFQRRLENVNRLSSK
jgi:DNA-binding transcriptional MerR regulator